LLSCYILTN